MTSILPDLMAALDKLYNDKREGVHVSDLTLCPRKAVLRRFEPSKTTPTELNFFTLGKSLHQAAQDLTKVHGDRFVKEQEVWLDIYGNTVLAGSASTVWEYDSERARFLKDHFVDINTCPVAHIDVYDTENNIPIEMKGIRKASIDQPKDFHVEQLKYYMAMVNAHKGIILYQLLMNFKDTPFKEFVITMDDKQLAEQRAKLLKESAGFVKALIDKDAKLARAVINDQDLNWQCDRCPFLERCQRWSK